MLGCKCWIAFSCNTDLPLGFLNQGFSLDRLFSRFFSTQRETNMKTRTIVLAAAAALALAAAPFVVVKFFQSSHQDLSGQKSAMQPAANVTKSHVIDVTAANYEAEVEKSSIPVIIDFSATWCGPCQSFAPKFQEAAKQYAGKVKFVHVDVDDAPGVASKFGVRSIPTIALMKNPKDGPAKASKAVGNRDLDSLKQFIEDGLK